MWYRAGGSPPLPFHAMVSETEANLTVEGTILDSIIWASRAFNSEELKLEHQVTSGPVQKLWQHLESSKISVITTDRAAEMANTPSASRQQPDDQLTVGLQEMILVCISLVYQEYKNLIDEGSNFSHSSICRETCLTQTDIPK